MTQDELIAIAKTLMREAKRKLPAGASAIVIVADGNAQAGHGGFAYTGSRDTCERLLESAADVLDREVLRPWNVVDMVNDA